MINAIMLSLSCQSICLSIIWLSIHLFCISASLSVGLSDCLFTSLTISLLPACLQVLVCLPLNLPWKASSTDRLL